MANELRDLQATDVTAPWVQNAPVVALNEALGEGKDEQTGLDRAALKMRFTSGALVQQVSARIGAEVIPVEGDTERLRRLGLSKRLARYDTETDAQYEARVDAAFQAHLLRSTPAAIISQLHAFGIPDVVITEEWAARICGDECSYGWRFEVVLGPNFGTLGWRPLTMPFKLGVPTILGISGASRAQISTVVRIILEWKNAFAWPLTIVFRFGDAPVLGVGLMLGFKLGGSAGSGYARRQIGESATLGKITMGFRLGLRYTI